MNYPTQQPRGFSVFFLTEMCERYGFYIVQALLVLYLTEHFHLSDTDSYGVLGSFTALAYINPILGGYVADKILGAKRSIIVGALLIALGYFILAFFLQLFQVLIALGVIAIGTGLLKPNISSLLSTLYQSADPRRYAGYTLFYVGINVGIILATSLGGYSRYYFGWAHTCLIAAIILLFAGFAFFWGSARYHIQDGQFIMRSARKYLQALFCILAAVLMNTLILKQQSIADIAFMLVAVISLFIVLYAALKAKGPARLKLIAYLLLVFISVFFWAIYFQLFFSMNLFVARAVDRSIFGFNIPPSLFVSIEALSLIILGPMLSILWRRLESRGKSLSVPAKFSLGVLMMAFAFATLFVSPFFLNAEGQVLAASLLLVYVLIAVGELMLSPTGLAMVTELVPRNLLGLMMGIFFVSLGLGGKLAGMIANYAAVADPLATLPATISIYHHAFGIYLSISVLVTVLSFIMIKPIKELIGTIG